MIGGYAMKIGSTGKKNKKMKKMKVMKTKYLYQL